MNIYILHLYLCIRCTSLSLFCNRHSTECALCKKYIYLNKLIFGVAKYLQTSPFIKKKRISSGNTELLNLKIQLLEIKLIREVLCVHV